MLQPKEIVIMENQKMMSPTLNDYIISEKIVETENTTSFYLKSTNGISPPYIPGAYLVFNLPAGDGQEMVKREYSISNWSEETIRVTIKREDAPRGKPDVEAGLISNYFHKTLQVGDGLSVFGPTGKFLLNMQSNRPVVLLSGGIGQTPMVSMAHALAEQANRKVYFIHACENSDMHALAKEMEVLEKSCPLLTTHICFEKPHSKDVLGKNYDSQGYVTRQVLENLLPLADYEFYVCGPGPFMQAMYNLITLLGINENRIFYEFFGPASLLKSENVDQTEVEYKHEVKIPSNLADDQPMVTFSKSELEIVWDSKMDNLLEFAEENGIMADFSCRAGTCDSCKVGLQKGNVEYVMEPMVLPPEGKVLLCCSIPSSNIVLDL